MAREWYFSTGAPNPSGPVDEPELARMLREGALPPTTMVWSADFGDGWLPAGQVPAFSSHAPLRPIPPPLPGVADGGEKTIRTIADYERISGIVWIVIAALQILSCAAAIGTCPISRVQPLSAPIEERITATETAAAPKFPHMIPAASLNGATDPINCSRGTMPSTAIVPRT